MIIYNKYMYKGQDCSLDFTLKVPWWNWMLYAFFSFLELHMALLSLLQCPGKDDVDGFISAVNFGAITWHAGPMNMEFEMLDASMMEFAIQLSIDLDKRFGIQRKYRIVSQRDVPGT